MTAPSQKESTGDGNVAVGVSLGKGAWNCDRRVAGWAVDAFKLEEVDLTPWTQEAS